MQGLSVGTFWEQWVGKESTGRRRSLIATLAVVVALLCWVALVEWANTDELLTVLAAVVVIIGAGVFARSWLVLATAYAAAVLMFWAVEIGTFLWIGGAEWESRNAEHWQGNEPAAQKLIGQLIEYAFFGLFLIPIIALGVALGRTIDQQLHDRDLEHSGA
jgi:lysylphosphatidylglycerol synthetase-like protein (DUF2156 family)